MKTDCIFVLVLKDKTHKAGFVSIIGRPNVGKSTLMNRLVGERLSIITSKAQTTRHRIMGIINGDDYQIVYSDTPGIIDPNYNLQEKMMGLVYESLRDADIIFYVVEPAERSNEGWNRKLKKLEAPVIVVINKIDLANDEERNKAVNDWKDMGFPLVVPVSALSGMNTNKLMDLAIENLPRHPAYFPKDALTDKTERFFAAEIIREKIFLNYRQEIPYSTDVAITDFKEEEKIIRIRAEIFVERHSQKGIIIGKKGSALKKVGIEARKDLEEFFDKQVYLETHVKILENWRRKEGQLRKLGF